MWEDRGSVEIEGSFVEYKEFVAQRLEPELNLGIRPIGVSGIILVRDGGSEYVLFARRAIEVTQYAGFLELVPSGSIDKHFVDADGVIDYGSKLLSEFVEETGLPSGCVEEITGLAVVLDQVENVYDICCKIVLNADVGVVTSAFSGTKEYDSPELVAVSALGEFTRSNQSVMVPTSVAVDESYLLQVSRS
jgi:hypothetical protein